MGNIEIRYEKQKPKLSDLLKMFEGKDLSNPKDREALKKKILALYEENDEDSKDEFKYSFDRILKIFNHQLAAIVKIDKRITQLKKSVNSGTPGYKKQKTMHL